MVAGVLDNVGRPVGCEDGCGIAIDVFSSNFFWQGPFSKIFFPVPAHSHLVHGGCWFTRTVRYLHMEGQTGKIGVIIMI